ncbi:PucR family transcriptional regulator [Amycolatopsis thermoflava]|uniref:PucR-like helix-turn-helix protein n=1 Tax=Amycolatopsis thermoflava TaxID=84480 RepID=A0A3N2G5X7_9PSEU|nr:helix-turn-helix domain-containing protein [Amycolatopsis thermoflava]ROS32052.1 PucR-like helix-turn-helix protein [Amycolatopsis thermoflava]
MSPELLRAVLEQAPVIAGTGRVRLVNAGPPVRDGEFAVPLGRTAALVVDGADGDALDRLVALAEVVRAAVAEHEARSAELAAERHLGALVGVPGGLAALVRCSAELTGKVTVLYDVRDRMVASASPPGASPIRMRSLDEIGVREGLAPARLDGLTHRHLVVPATHRDETFGRLVLVEHPSAFRPADRTIAHRAADHLGTEFALQRRVATVAWNARSSLARQLVRGSSTMDDLRSSGEYLGVDVRARRVLAYVLGSPADDQALAAEVEEILGAEVLGTRGSEGVLLLVEAGDGPVVRRVKAAVRRATRRTLGQLAVGVSSVCEPGALARAYREAREVAHCVHRFVGPDSPRILAVDDLGPARLFVANSAVGAVRAYVDDVLGPLLTADAADLLWTVQQYFDAGRSVRVSASRLGVHENTVRLRLARVRQATGLDVAADAGDQLTVQTALLVLRLQGHPALPAFDEGGLDEDGRKTA